MSQLILTVHTGIHDAGAALFRTTESPVEGAARRLNAGQLGSSPHKASTREFPRSPANAKGPSVDLIGLAHRDPAQRGEPTDQIEQDFIGAGPTDQGQTGGATRYGSDRNVDLRETANTGDASQSHGPYPK